MGFSGNINSAYGSGDSIIGTGSSYTNLPAADWYGTITYDPVTNTFSGTLGNDWPVQNNVLYQGSGNTIVGVGGGAKTAGTITYNASTNTFTGKITNITGANPLYGKGNSICDNHGCISYTPDSTSSSIGTSLPTGQTSYSSIPTYINPIPTSSAASSSGNSSTYIIIGVIVLLLIIGFVAMRSA